MQHGCVRVQAIAFVLIEVLLYLVFEMSQVATGVVLISAAANGGVETNKEGVEPTMMHGEGGINSNSCVITLRPAPVKDSIYDAMFKFGVVVAFLAGFAINNLAGFDPGDWYDVENVDKSSKEYMMAFAYIGNLSVAVCILGYLIVVNNLTLFLYLLLKDEDGAWKVALARILKREGLLNVVRYSQVSSSGVHELTFPLKQCDDSTAAGVKEVIKKACVELYSGKFNNLKCYFRESSLRDPLDHWVQLEKVEGTDDYEIIYMCPKDMLMDAFWMSTLKLFYFLYSLAILTFVIAVCLSAYRNAENDMIVISVFLISLGFLPKCYASLFILPMPRCLGM